MSCRWHKEVRALVFHENYGGNYRAMAQSTWKLRHIYKPTNKQYRRAMKMGERRIKKMLAADARWEERERLGLNKE